MSLNHYYELSKQRKSFLLLIALFVSVTLGQTTKSTELSLNRALEATISGNEPHFYELRLETNEFVQVRLRQKGVDLSVGVNAADGTTLAEMDSTAGNGLETLSWIADKAGMYRFVVKRLSEFDNAESGDYEIELIARNAATESNRLRLRAEALFIGMDKPRILSYPDVPNLLKQYKVVLTTWEELHDEYMTSLLKLMIANLETTQKRSSQIQADTDARTAIEDEIDASKRARLVVQTGHAGSVDSVTLSPDGRLLASTGSFGESIILWEVKSGKQLKSMSGPSNFLNSLAFSSDSAMLALGMGDGTIQVINTKNGERLKTLPPTEGASITNVAFLPDNKSVASTDWNDYIRIWNVNSGKPVLSRKLSDLMPTAFSPDGTILVTIAKDFSIVLLETRTGKEVKRLSGLHEQLWPIALSRDHNRVAGAGSDNKVIICNAETGRRVEISAGHSSRDLSFSPDGKTLLTATSRDDKVKWWDVETGILINSLDCSDDWVESITLSLDGRILACGTYRAVRLWNLETSSQTRTFGGQARLVSSIAFSGDGKTIASGSMAGPVKLWDLVATEPLRSVSDQSTRGELTAISRDGKMLASFGTPEKPGPSTISLWDIATGNQLRSLEGHKRNTISLAFSPDGKKLFSGGLDNKVNIWSVDTGQLIRSVGADADSGSYVAVSPDGRTFATGGSKDLSIRLWDTESGQQIGSFSGQTSFVESLTFSPDGQILASGDNEGTIQLWDAKTGSHLKALVGHGESVVSIAFSPDSKMLVSGSMDYTVKIWNIPGGQLIKSLLGHTSEVVSVAFSPEGNLIATGSKDATIKLWRFTGELLASLIILNKNDWAVITPNGLFDASPGARRLMHYVVELEPVGLEQMKDNYFVPGLLNMIVSGQAVPSKIKLFGAQDLFPRVEYQPPGQNQTSFKAKLVNRGGGIGPVQLFVNSKECRKDSGVDSRPPNFNSKQSFLPIQIDLAKCGLLIPGEQNQIELVTYNSAGSINSRGSTRGAQFVTLIEATARSEPPHIYAIVGGISQYGTNTLNLRYAASDAEDFAKTLVIGASRLVGPDRVHIRLLTSNGEKSKVNFGITDARISTAIKDNFRNAFDEFKKASPRDVFIVYLAGHGVSINLDKNVSNTDRDTYLYLTQEATTTELSDVNLRHGTAISSDELADFMKQNTALKQVLILDTCQSGAAVGSLTRRDLASDQIKAIDRLQSRIGFFVLTGSAADKE